MNVSRARRRSPRPPDFQLRPVEDGDLPQLFEQQCDPAASWMADFTSRDLPHFTAHWQRIRSDGSTRLRTIVVDGQVAGYISSFLLEGRREVGYWLGRDYWGRGIATQALKAFLEIEHVRPLHAYAVADNLASRRVLEKCGFQADGEVQEFSPLRDQEITGILFTLPAAPEEQDP